MIRTDQKLLSNFLRGSDSLAGSKVYIIVRKYYYFSKCETVDVNHNKYNSLIGM